MKRATALVSFHDLKEGVLRNKGDAFLCDDERGEYLAGIKFVRLEDVQEKPKRPRKTKK